MFKIQNKKHFSFRSLGLRFDLSNLFRISNFEFRISNGFALVELLVAVALLGIAASSALLLFGAVSDRLFLRNLAYGVALSLRQAQSYGVSVRGTDATAFEAGYGLHFEAANNRTFLLFADKNNDARFNGTRGVEYDISGCFPNTECLQVFLVERENRIEKFCGVLATSGSAEECSTDTSAPLTYLDISFRRPEPDAVIVSNRSDAGVERYKAARIYLASPRNATEQVEVANTGQISVK